MSSLARQNWQKELSDQTECFVRVTSVYILRRIAQRVEERINASRKRKRSCWVRPWLLRRYQLGAYDALMVELANEDLPNYVALLRVAPDLFAELLSKVEPIIRRQDTVMRPSISAGARLALTLRYLATGNKIL